MAENIGKVQIAIEAQTAELQQGLAKAEKAVKDSAKKMEQSTEKLSQKAEKSWTEFASKMGVVQQIGAIAQQVWNGLDGVLEAVTQRGANASQRLTGGLDAIESAGIPVVSQFLAIGRGIYGWISGEKALQKEIDQRNAKLKQIAEREIKGSNERIALRQALTASTENFLQLMGLEAEMAGKATDREKLQLKLQREREGLLEQFAEREQELKGKASEQFLSKEKKRFEQAFELFRQKQDREVQAFNKAEQERTDIAKEEGQKRADDDKRIADMESERTQREAKANALLKMSLQERHRILQAKQAGDEERAGLLAIKSRFRQEMEGKTKAQVRLLKKMRKIEKDMFKEEFAEAEAPKATGVDKQEMTATLATAIGSFTVATGETKKERETKKQTSLLETIAQNTTRQQGEQIVQVAT